MADIDRYVFDSLMADLVNHERSASAFLVYLMLWHRSRKDFTVSLSLGRLAYETGLSKTAVQKAIAVLVRRQLIAVEKEYVTAVPVYKVLRPWRR